MDLYVGLVHINHFGVLMVSTREKGLRKTPGQHVRRSTDLYIWTCISHLSVVFMDTISSIYAGQKASENSGSTCLL